MTSTRVKKRVSEAFALDVDFSLGAGTMALIGPTPQAVTRFSRIRR